MFRTPVLTKTAQRISVSALVATLLIGLPGCANLETRERASVLRTQVVRYAKTLRWGDYEGANAYILRQEGTERVENVSLLQKIRVTKYEVLDTRIDADNETARARIRLSYFHTDRRIESSITDTQIWRFNTDAKGWFIDGNLPDFAAGLRRNRN